MAWTLAASGTQTATVNTEHTLATDTTNGTFYFEADISAMALGDVLELRIYVMTLAAGTLRLAWKSTWGPALPTQGVAVSPPQASDQSFRATLKQIAGTGRSYPWKVLKV